MANELKKGRIMAKYIYNNSNNAIEDTLRTYANKLFKLIESYASFIIDSSPDKKYNKEEIILDHMMPLESQKIGNCGQIPRSMKNLLYTLKHGNIRELLTLIFNFRNSCYVIWDILKLYNLDSKKYNYYFGNIIKEKRLNQLIDDIVYKLGVPLDIILQTCYSWLTEKQESKCFQTTDPTSLCSYVFYPVAKQIITVRCIKEGFQHRKKREDVNNTKKKIKVKDVVPPLSKLEKEFILKFQKDINLENKETYVPWISGADYYDSNKDSFFYQLYNKLNKTLLTGPSGSADFVLNLSTFFGFTRNQTIDILLGLIVWMCIPGDHNVFEIISIASKFKFIDYKNLTNDEYDYITRLVLEKNTVSNASYSLPSYVQSYKKKI
jgi:hypothetical protein